VEKIETHEMVIRSRGKKVKRTIKKATDTVEIEEEEQEVGLFDSILVEPYPE